MKNYIIITLLVASFLATNALSANSKKRIVKKVNHITTIEDESDDITIKMKKGKLEGIKLPVKMATGYSWILVKHSDNLKQPFKPRIIQPKKKEEDKEVSIKEFQIFYIRALESGSGMVEFEHRQPFDKESPPDKEIKIKIEVE
ncbi:MAG TPA: protease inhibitor I42 family protein [Leptospiraceae bacterium]|nr:protease inhibitor I42 family protein [Leptospiraceae bacterium]HMW06304.1 protease inhibitor I42 family protein [Leptospiraceae bacterium]HMX31017.1 protease inhibitor I42 family protein [Leptospiraceae bacterium]HMY32164.1 protease inhibitor I42 family protein [Leptospiraceae bacterium]HMZ65107.1 protease inhibitor I42 family protein [Leptospiraceae bacterium]